MKDRMEFIQEQLARIKRAYQLPNPDPSYITDLKTWLHEENWKGVELLKVVNELLVDVDYAQRAQYNRYPFFSDFSRIRENINPFVERIKQQEQEREQKTIGLSDAIKQIGSK